MKHLRLLTALAVALPALIPSSHAGPATGSAHVLTGDLTLDRAVQTALAQNPEILKQLQEIERTRGQIVEVRAQALPHLGVTGAFNYQDPRLTEINGRSRGSSSASTVTTTTTAPDGTASTTQTAIPVTATNFSQSGVGDKSWNVNITAKQVLYAGGQVRAAIHIAKFTEDSSYFQLRDIVDQIISQTRSQFYDVLLTRALITVQEESISLLSDQLKDQQNRLDAGTVPRFNVLRAEVELSNARPDLIRARNSYLLAELQLAKTLGLDPGPNGKPTFNCTGEFQIIERPLGLLNALQLAREKRAYLKVQRQQILIAKEQIKVALAGYKPRLDASAGYEFRNSRLSDELDKVVDGWFYGVTGSWNIFDGLETAGKVQQARAQLASSKINYDDSVQKVELEVQQSYANLQAARETIRSQQKNVEQALEDLEFADAVEGRLAIRAGIEAEGFGDLELRDEVAVLRADQVGAGVGQLDFGAQDVETRDGASVETVLLVLELVAQELDGFLLHFDERAVEQHVVKLCAGLRDDAIHGVAQLVVAAVLGELRDANRGAHLAAGVEDLLGGDVHVPRFVADPGAELAETRGGRGDDGFRGAEQRAVGAGGRGGGDGGLA